MFIAMVDGLRWEAKWQTLQGGNDNVLSGEQHTVTSELEEVVLSWILQCIMANTGIPLPFRETSNNMVFPWQNVVIPA